MNNNTLFAIVGALVVATTFLGYRYYEDHREPSGIEITIGKGGIDIDKK
jgi:hypothetical protein